MSEVGIDYKEKFREILSEYLEEVDTPTTPREAQPQVIPKKASVITGVRRCGKSILAEQMRIRLGVIKNHTIKVNFSDERLSSIESLHLGKMLEAFYSLVDFEPTPENPLFFILDEIQLVPKWELFVDRLLRSATYRVVITGSSSHLLSQEIATQMRGRSVRWELFPFSFREYLRAKNFTSKLQTAKIKTQKSSLLDHYLVEGGFPETVDKERTFQIQILQEYYNSIIFKDVIERHKISHQLAAKNILNLLLNQVGSLFTLNKLFERIKCLGFHIHKSFVSEVLTALEDAYAIFTLPIFSESVHKQQVNPKKIYCIDTGLVCSIQSGFSKNIGRLMENIVFLHIRRYEPQIWYYKTKSGREVDFIFRGSEGELNLVQVCADLSDPETREREIAALREASKEQPDSKCFLITREVNQSKIDGFSVISLVDFLLSDPRT